MNTAARQTGVKPTIVLVVAALWPDRCTALVSVSGYLIGSQAASRAPLPPQAELAWWYQFYFATDRGQAGYEKYRREFSVGHNLPQEAPQAFAEAIIDA